MFMKTEPSTALLQHGYKIMCMFLYKMKSSFIPCKHRFLDLPVDIYIYKPSFSLHGKNHTMLTLPQIECALI